MTATQPELPLWVYSTAADPFDEQERTHPAQMIIKHCGNSREHVSHPYVDPHPFGCPGMPDLRDTWRAHAR